MKDKEKYKDVPKAGAEGDKFPEENMKEIDDPMNTPGTNKAKGDVPKATAEGDKLPEEDC